MMYPEDVSIDHIIDGLLSITMRHVRTERTFIDFMTDLAPENIWKVWKFNKEDPVKDYTYPRAVISKCLSVLSSSKIEDIENGLDDPDYSLLPKHERCKSC